jgi:glutamine cyclotransferase
VPISTGNGLQIVRTTDANGWVVLPDGFGIWVAGAGTLTRIDPRTGATKVTAHGPWDYDFVRLAEYGEGSIYVTFRTKLLTMDAGSGTVITTMNLSSLGYVDSVLSDHARSLWVAASGEDGSQVLAEIDTDTGKVVKRVHRIGQGLHVLVRAGGYVFVSSNGGNGPTLLRVDPHTLATTRVRGAPPGTRIAGVGSHLWMTGGDGVRCLDAFTLESCGGVEIPGFIRVAADGRDLWVLSAPMHGEASVPGADRHPTITLVNGRNGNVLAGPLPIPGNHPSSVAAFQGRAWVGYYTTGNVTEIARCAPGTCRDRQDGSGS